MIPGSPLSAPSTLMSDGELSSEEMEGWSPFAWPLHGLVLPMKVLYEDRSNERSTWSEDRVKQVSMLEVREEVA